MTRLNLVSIAFLVSGSLNASELSANWDWTVSTDSISPRSGSPLFSEEAAKEQSLDALLALELNRASLTGAFALLADDLYQSQSASSNENHIIVRELFWQGELELGGEYWDFTIGKIRQDYGVAYGYRPLDVFHSYRRNPVGIQVEEGVGLLSLSHYGATGEWALLATTSSMAQQKGNDLQEASKQNGVGARFYGLKGDSEYQLVAYYDTVRQGLVGGSWVTVFGQEWEWHSSAVVQRKHMTYVQPDTHFSPVEIEEKASAYQVLTGLTWSGYSGHSVIAEYWFDSRAWSGREWQNAFESASSLRNDYAQDGLANSYALGLSGANLVQHNVMLHWTLDTQNWQGTHWDNAPSWFEKITPSFDFIASPEDGGVIATPRIGIEWYDDGNTRFETELAARFYDGKSGSVYKNLHTSHMILLNLKGKF
ncbi:hypothetical protein [Vibrio sp. S9_S30]|uniref:hypothetical protein n=1 Tax=Vibrio sp. S9_S30 TaxID=2720226 RepID=UPI003138E32A